jgi:hypothetical protein
VERKKQREVNIAWRKEKQIDEFIDMLLAFLEVKSINY